MRHRQLRLLAATALFALVVAACSTATPATNTPASDTVAPTTGQPAERDTLVVPLTLYRLIDTDGSGLGTARTTEELEAIALRMNDIWGQADITFDPLLVRDIELPASVLAPIVQRGDIDLFTDALRTASVPDPGVINGFYLSEAFGVNGFAPTGTRIFFVVDEPTVPDERVSSHEIGHLFGLHHTTDNPSRLLFSGTSGTTLNFEEQTVSRYAAQGIIDGQR